MEAAKIGWGLAIGGQVDLEALVRVGGVGGAMARAWFLQRRHPVPSERE